MAYVNKTGQFVQTDVTTPILSLYSKEMDKKTKECFERIIPLKYSEEDLDIVLKWCDDYIEKWGDCGFLCGLEIWLLINHLEYLKYGTKLCK